ncbi:MAG: protein kinase [Sideroxydans sp.]|nr:protein kinase [Sideroxydans sp.]
MISHLGRYEIIEELGRGAMGTVYKATDPLIERFVAIKAINLHMLPEKEKGAYKARFYQEAKAAGHLNHPNVVTIHDLGESGDIAYIAMELMEGRELQSIIDGDKHLAVEDALHIAIQVATGLFYAHQHGIVHRDIKPTNIMVLGGNHAKIADFGIARMPSSLTLTQTGMIIGSPMYMSPEQIMSESTDARSDIFSLGIVLYQMLTGRLPFAGDNANSLMFAIVNEAAEKPSSLNPEVPDALDRIVAKCLAKKPEERYANANELAEDLRSCLDKLVRTKTGLEHPLISGAHFKRLQRLAVPGAVSPNFVAVGSFIAMGVIFAVDMITKTRIQMHMLYIFPLIMVSYHCEQMKLVKTATTLSLLLQGIMLMSDTNLSILAKTILAILVLPSNIMVAYVSRIARTNFMEVGHLASFDRLTGLRNRLNFESIADMEIVRQKKHGGIFSFAFVDIDNLSELNGSRGYLVGDGALKILANVMREHIRESDTIARLGGDEFAILMPNTGATDCERLCKQLSEKISKRMAEESFPVSASIGYATFEQAPASISEIFLRAENAVHIAQSSGKGCVVRGSRPHR